MHWLIVAFAVSALRLAPAEVIAEVWELVTDVLDPEDVAALTGCVEYVVEALSAA